MYISLIDENEASNILKMFNCNVRVNNLDLMKTKIKTILRSGSTLKKIKGNPFINVLVRHKKKRWDMLNEKEFLIELNNNFEYIPDYVKCANLLLKYPDKKNKYIDIINENRIEGRYIFDFGLKFDNKKEIQDYYIKLLENRGNIVDIITEYIIKAYKSDLVKVNEKKLRGVSKCNIVDLHNMLKKDDEQMNMFLKFEYLRKNEDVDVEIFNKFSYDIIIYLLHLFEKSYIDIKSSIKDENKIELDENQIDYYRLEKEKLEKEVKILKKELKKKTTDIKLHIEECKKTQIEIQKIKSDNYKCFNEIEELTKKNEELENENSIFNIKLAECNEKINSYMKKIKNDELYYEYSFLKKDSIKLFGVIHSIDINIAKIIFQEIEFINIASWRENINRVKKIYIQIEGISKRQLSRIKEYCELNEIEIIKSISIHDEKSLIEKISIIKNSNMKGLG